MYSQQPENWEKTLTISEARVAQFGSNSYKPITNTAWVCVRLWKLQKGALDSQSQVKKAYQLLAHGRLFLQVV
jgi:hypothetical protein